MRCAIIVSCLTISAFSLPVVDCYGSDTLTPANYQSLLNSDSKRISQDSFKIAEQHNSHVILDRQKRFGKRIKLPKIQSQPIKPGPITEDKSGNINIRINAKPGAKKTEITGVGDDAIGVRLNAPAKEGKANSELLNYLSDVLNVKKKDIDLLRGHKSRDKTVVVGGSGNSPESFMNKIFDWIKKQ